MIVVACRVLYGALLVALRGDPLSSAALLLVVAVGEWLWSVVQLDTPSSSSSPMPSPVKPPPAPGSSAREGPTISPLGQDDQAPGEDEPVDYTRFSRVFSLQMEPSKRIPYSLPASPRPRPAKRRAPPSSSPSQRPAHESTPASPPQARPDKPDSAHSPAKRLPARTLDGDRAHHVAKCVHLEAPPPTALSPLVAVPHYRAPKPASDAYQAPASPACPGEYEIVPQNHLSRYADYQASAHRQQLAQQEKARAEAQRQQQEAQEAQRRQEQAQREAAERKKKKEEEEAAQQRQAAQEAEAARQAQEAAEKDKELKAQEAQAQKQRETGPLPSRYYEEHILALTSTHAMPPDLHPPKPLVYTRITFTDESIDTAVREIIEPWKNYAQPTPVAAAFYWKSVSERMMDRKKIESALNLILPLTEVLSDVAQAYPEFAQCFVGKLCHAYPLVEGRVDAKITERFPSNAKFTGYIKDSCAVLGMYALALIRRKENNPFGGLEKAWEWLSRVGNTPPTEETPWVLHKFLQVTAHPLLQRYPTQFPKLIRYFAEVYCPLFKELSQKYINAPTTQLLKYFEDFARDRSFTPYDQITVT